MHGIHAEEDEPMSQMNLIPLIDIALTMLIIMMVTTVFIKKPGVNLTLPETATREGAPETQKDLTIYIGVDNKMYVDAKEQKPDQVQGLLTATAKKNKDARVLVKADRAVMYAKVMEVMDMARQAGLTHITLPTEPKKDLPANLPP
ncbi:MAG: biopolymer transporter ExbD [Chthonomonadaceae bacterium]|nr:biopolymer transporter ExbD [Chthonomonadaceae bacterium]